MVAAIALAGCGGGGGGGSAGGGFPLIAAAPTTEAAAAGGAGAGAGTGAGTGSGSGSGAGGSGGGVSTTVQSPAQCAPIRNDVVDSFGNVVAASYRSTAALMSKDAGIAYRYGPSPAECGTSGNGGFPTYYRPPDVAFPTSIDPSPIEFRGKYQVGGPLSTDPGPYFSNNANVTFVADNPAAYVGVSVFQQLAAVFNVFSQAPQISRIYPDGINDPNARNYGVNNPVAMGRCGGRPGWCVNAIVAYQNGLVGTARGSNTALNESTAQLDAGMVPTAVAVTNSGEFALVTVWDTVNVRGRVAVIALTGLCNGCNLAAPNRETYWGEWNAAYPGLPNLGNFGYMKLLGYVELPDMKAPTEISATTGVSPWDGYNATSQARDALNLSVEANRQTFVSGVNANTYAKAGVAVVASKSERKVVFIDLKPLFAYYKKMYFGSPADFARTSPVGPGGQWPFTFAAAPEQVPAVIKTVTLANPPTAVKTGLWGTPRAWVATQEGKLRTFALGNYLSPTANGAAAQIVESASFDIGKNPTGLTYSRGLGDTPNERLIVVSRGERKVQWINVGSGAIERTLQDTTLVDPISADDNETTGASVKVITLADYGGRGVSNFRYSTLIMHSGYTACQGSGCPTVNASGGPAPFENGGRLALPGGAFHTSGANAP